MVRTGIFVDAENIRLNGGFGMRYDVLMDVVKRMEGTKVIRANAYVVEDPQRLQIDQEAAERLYKYFEILRGMGYRLVKKRARTYYSEGGETQTKANVDMDIAIDVLTQADRLDRIILLTGDGDFVRLVNAVQNKGCRVEVIAFRNVSGELRDAVDRFTNGYLVPGLLPIPDDRSLRGFPDGDKVATHGYGFFRTYKFQEEHLVEETIFFHVSKLLNMDHQEKLANPNNIFEFDLEPSDRREGDMQATNIVLAAENVRI